MNYLFDDPRRAAETMFLLQAAVESANDAILITELELDAPGPRIEYVNPAFTRMTGYSAEESLGKTPRFLQGAKTDRALLSRLRQDLAGGQSFHGQTVNYRKDGSEYFVEWRITPVKNSEGKAIKWVAVQRDVTEREKAEQALRASELHLKRANKDLEQFVYSASHDLQEPIRNVLIHSQYIQRQHVDSLPPAVQSHFNTIIEGAQRMGSLVRDLLAYTHAADQGSTDLNTPANGERVLSGVLADLDPLLKDTGAVVTHDPLPSVAMHDTHLRQILQNLITNGIKYRQPAVRPLIHVSAALSSDLESVTFAVKDNGIGIAPEYHEEVFGVFRRLHGRQYPGTGMGLAIAQRIVERYGERIWVESSLGEGSTFRFTAKSAVVDSER